MTSLDASFVSRTATLPTIGARAAVYAGFTPKGQSVNETSALSDLLSQCSSQTGALQSTIDGLNATLTSDASELTQLASQVADLTSKLAAKKQPPSPLITQFLNIEAMDGWIWPKGTQGNTNGTGNTGVATWLYDASLGAARASITPTLPKLSTAAHANYNAYFYNPLAGTNNGKALPLPAINPLTGVFVYSAKYFVGADQWAFKNQAENEIRWHTGKGFRHIMASALRIGAKVPTVHIFDWSVTSGDKWVDTGVACNMKPDTWYQIDTLWKADLATNTTTCVGFWIEGQFHPYNHVQPPNPYSGASWFLASVQPDSDGAGDPFNYMVRDLNVTIL